jgi:serine/threonine protein kinase
MAPELFYEGAELSKEADIYAFGITVYEVITEARPFGRRRMDLPFPPTIRGIRPYKPEDPIAIGFGEGTWEFVERCWDGNWERRPTAREALMHFKCVARTSTTVDPGPLVPLRGAATTYFDALF